MKHNTGRRLRMQDSPDAGIKNPKVQFKPEPVAPAEPITVEVAKEKKSKKKKG